MTATFIFAFTTCSEDGEDGKDGDTTKPVINLIEPENDDTLQIGGTIHFDAEFSDNEMLASYKVDIHNNFDNHGHATKQTAETVAFEYIKTWPLSKKNEKIHHHEIAIPENATPGEYHLMIYCTDAAGNESYIAVDVELSREAGEHEHDD
jgi:hypothetical protein